MSDNVRAEYLAAGFTDPTAPLPEPVRGDYNKAHEELSEIDRLSFGAHLKGGR